MTIYVFDSNPLIVMFNFFYPERFPTLWTRFNALIAEGRITSTREVYQELTGRSNELAEWCRAHRNLFPVPSRDELDIVTKIFQVRHFQAMVERKKTLQGKPVADPFIVARAKCVPNGCVVTNEKHSENAARIPNVCERFGVDWTDLEGFMRRENWTF